MTAPVPSSTTARRVAGRATPVADQLVWSAANVVTIVAAARLLTTSEFGTFSAALLIVLIVLAISRSFVTEPVMLGVESVTESDERDLRSRVVGAAVVLGAPLAAVGAAGLVLFDDGFDPTILVVFALACWANVAQDSVRFVALASGHPGVALASDAAWLACSSAFLALTFGGSTAGPSVALAVWGCGAASGLIVGLTAFRVWPRVSGARGWIASNAGLGWRLAADASAGVIAASVSFLLLGLIAGREELAGLRGAYLLLGPMNAVTEGLYLAIVPVLAVKTRGGLGVRPEIVRLAIGLTVVWALFALALLAVPDSWMTAALGDSWQAAEPVLPLLLIASVFGAVAISAIYGVRAWRDARSLVRVRAVLVPCYLVVLPLASWWNGAVGYATALIGVAVVQIVLYGSAFVRAESRRSIAS